MKLIHTGDWHLGKRLLGVSMIEDQAYALSGLLKQIQVEKPDVLIIAGDIYDRSVPPVEAIALADDFFRQLRAAVPCQVVLISGNHDSQERLGFGRGFLASSDVFVSTTYQDALEPLRLKSASGDIQCFAMPFLEPIVVKALWEAKGQEWTWPLTQQGLFEHMKTQWEPLFDAQMPKILVAHAFVGSSIPPELSESERPLSIGGQEIVEASLLDGFDYVALGHLHRPQKVGRETLRYAGSLLKYSFSEAIQAKGLTWVKLTTKGVEHFQTQLPLLRDVRVIEGTLEQLIENPLGPVEDYVMVVLKDEGALFEPMRRLRAVYPNCLKMERQGLMQMFGGLKGVAPLGDGATPSGDGGFIGDTREVRFEDLSPQQVFERFYSLVMGEMPEMPMQEIYEKAVHAGNKEGYQ